MIWKVDLVLLQKLVLLHNVDMYIYYLQCVETTARCSFPVDVKSPGRMTWPWLDDKRGGGSFEFKKEPGALKGRLMSTPAD